MLVFLNTMWFGLRSVFLRRFLSYLVVLLLVFSLMGVVLSLVKVSHIPLIEYLKTTISADAVLFDQHLTLGVSAKERGRSLQYTQAIVAIDVAHTLYTHYTATILGVNALSYPLNGSVLIDNGHHFFQLTHGPTQGAIWISPQLGAALNVVIGQSIVIGHRSFLVQFWLDDIPGRFLLSAYTAPLVMMNIDDFVRLSIPHAEKKQDVLLMSGPEEEIHTFVSRLSPSPAAHLIVASHLATSTMPAPLQYVSRYCHVYFLSLFIILCAVLLFWLERHIQDVVHITQVMSALGVARQHQQQWLYAFFLIFWMIFILILGMLDYGQASRWMAGIVLHQTGLFWPFSLVHQQLGLAHLTQMMVLWGMVVILVSGVRYHYGRWAGERAFWLKNITFFLAMCTLCTVFLYVDQVSFIDYLAVFILIFAGICLLHKIMIYGLSSRLCAEGCTRYFLSLLSHHRYFFSHGWRLLLVLLAGWLVVAYYIASLMGVYFHTDKRSAVVSTPITHVFLPEHYLHSAKGIFLQKKNRGASRTRKNEVWKGHVGVIFSDHMPIGFDTDHFSLHEGEVVVTHAFARKNNLRIGDEVIYLFHGRRYPLAVSAVITPCDASIAYPFSWIVRRDFFTLLTAGDEKPLLWQNTYVPVHERLFSFGPYQRQQRMLSHHSPHFLLALYQSWWQHLSVWGACLALLCTLLMIWLSFDHLEDSGSPDVCTVRDLCRVFVAFLWLCLPVLVSSLVVLSWVLSWSGWLDWLVFFGIGLSFLSLMSAWVVASFYWHVHRRMCCSS